MKDLAHTVFLEKKLLKEITLKNHYFTPFHPKILSFGGSKKLNILQKSLDKDVIFILKQEFTNEF